MKFNETTLRPEILKSLEEIGFEEMTPIQENAIPKMIEGRDIVGLAQTGTGKTAAFGLPILERIDESVKGVQGLVLCPTRELAVQCANELEKMAKNMNIRILAVYGGQDITRQFTALKKGVSVVIGTPGRVMDHMRRKTLKLDNLKTFVLDEADEMLNMGFREDIEKVCEQLPENHQTALFSATMAKEIMEITEKYQNDAEVIEVSHDEMTVSSIKQSFYKVKGRQKDEALCRLIDYMSPKRALIFCNTKRKVDALTVMLKRRGYSAEALHGDLVQQQRDRVMDLFRSGNLDLLLATDVAARGIDVSGVDVVFNYDLPQEMEYYVHRIGRTGRAGNKGKAVSLLGAREAYKIDALQNFCNTKIKEKKMPTYADVLPIKANNNITRAMEYCESMDLSDYETFVKERCEKDGIDPIKVAAVLVRESMGENREDMDIVTDSSDRGGRNSGRGRRRDGGRRNDRSSRSYRKSGRSSKDGRSSRDGRSGERRSSEGRSGEGRSSRRSDRSRTSSSNRDRSGRRRSERRNDSGSNSRGGSRPAFRRNKKAE